MESFTVTRSKAAEWFKEKQYATALKLYMRLLAQFEQEELNDVLNTDLSTIYSNASQCCLMLESWEQAKDLATKCLNISPNNVKALYRRSIANQHLGFLAEALDDVKNGQLLDPQNLQINQRVSDLRKSIFQQCENQLTEQLPETAIQTLEISLSQFITLPQDKIFTASLHDLPSSTVCLTIDNALRVLRVRIVSKKSLGTSLLKKVVPYLAAVLSCVVISGKGMYGEKDQQKDIFKKSDSSSLESLTSNHAVQNKYFLGILMQVLRTLNCFCVYQYSSDASAICGAAKTPESSNSSTVQSKETEIFQQEFCKFITPALILQTLKQCIRCGVGTLHWAEKQVSLDHIFNENIVSILNALRTTCVIFALRILRQNSSTRSSDCLEALSCAVIVHESVPIINCCLETAAFLMDAQRRRGKRVLHLIKSQPLIKFLEGVIQLLVDPCDMIQKNAEFVLTSTFTLLADKDRPVEDNVPLDEFACLLFKDYLDCSGRSREDAEKNLLGLKSLVLLGTADRNAAKSFLLEHHYLDTLLLPRLADPILEFPELKTEVLKTLLFSLEFRELRCNFLDAKGLSLVETQLGHVAQCDQDWIDQLQLLLIVVRLSIHEKALCEKMFQGFCLSKLTAQTVVYVTSSIASKPPQTLLTLHRFIFEIFFFLSLHERFKKTLLEKNGHKKELPNPMSDLLDLFIEASKFSIREEDNIACFFYAGAVCNLLQSRNSKERVRRQCQPGDLQLDEDQMDALKEFYNKLPDHCKPSGCQAQYDRGSDELKEKFHCRLIESHVPKQLAQICLWSQQKASLNLLSSYVNVLSYLCENQSCRLDISKMGCISPLIRVAERFSEDTTGQYKEDLDRCRQVLAQLCIPTNPSILSYKEKMSILSQLLCLLSHSYELYQYEACLAVTNIISNSPEARDSLYFQKGVPLLINIAASDNDLCRAAGVEALCNMALCEPFRERIIQGRHQLDLQLILAFLMEHENQRAQTSAAGCLAMLTNDPQVFLQLFKCPNISNLQRILQQEQHWLNNEPLQLRLLAIVLNISSICRTALVDSEACQVSSSSPLINESMIEFERHLVETLVQHWSQHLSSLTQRPSDSYSEILRTHRRPNSKS